MVINQVKLYSSLLLLVVNLVGCSSFRNYDQELTEVSHSIGVGNIDYALNILEVNNKKDKDLLYFMEKGELLRLKGDLQASQMAWMSANGQVQQWEDAVKVDPAHYVNNVLAYLWNDKVRRYDGNDYEKVMLTTQMALNYLAMGDWESARVAIKQTHERESLIANIHDLLYLKREEAAEDQGVNVEIKDLQGYPIETLNTPSVLSLKNGYQNAFSHYLAGYIYEALGEADLAAPGYRNAIQLRPNIPILQHALANLGSPKAHPANSSDVLIVMESGLAPKLESFSFNIPVPTRNGIIQIAISLPVSRNIGLGSKSNKMMIHGNSYSLVEVADIDAMSRRALRDELPTILLRTVVRATARAVTQQQLNKEVSPWAGLFFGLMGAFLEQADVRTWRTLPESIQIARIILPKGKQQIMFSTGERFDVMISNNYQVIQFAQIGNKVYQL